MIQKHQNILIQGWMLDYIDGMSAEDGKKYLHCLIESAAAGEVITDNPLWEYWLEKSLSAIEETRAKYYAKAKKNGEKGKEFGQLGGRPRKGESAEDYIIRKKGEDSQWTLLFNEVKQDKELIMQIKNGSMPKETFNELSEKYSKETLIDVLRWIKEKM